MALYQSLATITMFVHTILILSIFAGIVFSIRYPWFRPIESGLLLSAVTIWSFFGGCPLTFAEDYLRRRAENPRPLITEGFIPYYLDHWLRIRVTDVQFTIGTVIITSVFVLLSLYWLWNVRLERKHERSALFEGTLL